MILSSPNEDLDIGALNEMKALPSKYIISNLGSATNGFLFSTTPIILSILKSICINMDDSACSFIASGWLYGSIVGILLFGYIGDLLGYYKGMLLSTFLAFLGIFLGALSISLSPTIIPFGYGISRILMGIGCGGSIPIAYTRTSDKRHGDSSAECTDNRTSKTSSILLLLQSSCWVSSFLLSNTKLFGPVLFFLLLSYIPNTPRNLSLILQIILCISLYVILMLVLSSLPSLISFLLLIKSYHSIIYLPLRDDDNCTDHSSVVVNHVKTKDVVQPLLIAFLATGGTWFLYDFNSYGNTFFSRRVIESIVNIPNSPLGTTIPLIIAGLFGVPGQMFVGMILDRLGVKWMQLIGFVILSILFAFTAIGFSLNMHLNDSTKFILFILYHLTFFFSTCGPGSTTYILPSFVYSTSDLSFYHGICTCMGKLGGAIGATLFPLLFSKIGVMGTMTVCSVISLVSALITSLLRD